MKKLAVITLFISALSSLHAQSPPPTGSPAVLPPGPLLERAPDFSQWTIVFKASVDKPKPGEKPVADNANTQTLVTKTKQIYFIQSVLGVGTRTQTWSLGDVQVTIVPHARYPILSTRGNGGDYLDFSKQDFFGFAWISAKAFVGTQKVSGSDCLVFKDRVKMPSGSSLPDGSGQSAAIVDATAAIDLKTRLPVSLQTGDAITTYQFGPAPTVMLVPPASVQALVDGWRKHQQRAALIPPS